MGKSAQGAYRFCQPLKLRGAKGGNPVQCLLHGIGRVCPLFPAPTGKSRSVGNRQAAPPSPSRSWASASKTTEKLRICVIREAQQPMGLWVPGTNSGRPAPETAGTSDLKAFIQK